MADAIQRRGEWWQEQPGGGWLRWSETSQRWEPQDFPPPPPDPDPATEPARVEPPAASALPGSTGTSPIAGTAPAPTPGYKYEKNDEGVWWARNERTGQLHFYDAGGGVWKKYEGSSQAQIGQQAGSFSYAGFWERFAASVIDGVVTSIGSYALGFFIGMMGISEYSTPEEADMVAGFAGLAGFVAQWVYFAVMESSSKQATLGKMALGLRVTDMEGRRVSFGKATGRYFGKFVSALIIFIGFLMVAWTPQKQGLHDQMAGTLVLKGRP